MRSRLPFHHKRRRGPAQGSWRAAIRSAAPVFVAAPLAAVCAVWLTSGPPAADALPQAHGDPERARFARCSGPVRTTCVVDGDTIWYRGEKIRIADINTPEIGHPGCAAERRLGERATTRLTALLNAGAFSIEPNPDGRDTDVYDRKLRVLTRGGASLGDTLVREGLAEEWQGYRRDWC